MDYLSIPNFDLWQHYKDRNPPWIKLHRGLLSNYEFTSLPDVSKSHLMLLWLLASQSENKIPNDCQWVARQIGANETVDLDHLVELGFLVPYAAKPTKAKFSTRYISGRVKQAVYSRDKGRCRACNASELIEYDHVVPVSQGGTSDESNIQLLCRSCNRRKRTRSNDSFAAEHSATHTLDPVATQERSQETEVEEDTIQEEESLSKNLAGDWDSEDPWGVA